MYYSSTRDDSIKVSSMQAIAQGISKDGGLFVPQKFVKFSYDDFKSFSKLSYQELAVNILKGFLTDFSEDAIKACVNKAYAGKKFDDSEPVKCVDLNGTNAEVLELWHGPTSAFKDMALQMLPHLLTSSLKETGKGKQAVILTATSGDTGKAALEGFKDVNGVRIMVFYPEDGVSSMQKRQMQTQEGDNVYVCAVKGNFDDVQTGIKKIFTDKECNALLGKNGMMFSSANSINWGRLLPQIVYYFYAYCKLIQQGKVTSGNDKVNFVVPTGNFGNILSAYYAQKMGLPVNKLICASNSNNILTDFINTGIYDKNRKFYLTMSPSMDILVSSNLERLLYDLTDKNTAKVSQWLSQLDRFGKYEVDDDVKSRLKEKFFADFTDENETRLTIKYMLDKYSYLCDTHTAVALNVYKKYAEKTGDTITPAIIASTASPYKFSKDVLSCIDEHITENIDNDFDYVKALSKISKTNIPKPISELENKRVRFTDSCEIGGIKSTVLSHLGL